MNAAALTGGESGDMLGAMKLTANLCTLRSRSSLVKILPAGEVTGAQRCAIF
jgi:hypothetical protein